MEQISMENLSTSTGWFSRGYGQLESTRKQRSQRPAQRDNQEHTASCQDGCQLIVEKSADVHSDVWTCQIESFQRSWDETISKTMGNLTVLIEKPYPVHDM